MTKVQPDVGTTYILRVKRRRGLSVTYEATCVGHGGDYHYFTVPDQPGVRLSIDAAVIESAEEVE
jgi:hypothetical protein